MDSDIGGISMADQTVQVCGICGTCGYWVSFGEWGDQDSMGMCPLTNEPFTFLHPCKGGWVPEDPPGSKRLPDDSSPDQYVYNKKE